MPSRSFLPARAPSSAREAPSAASAALGHSFASLPRGAVGGDVLQCGGPYPAKRVRTPRGPKPKLVERPSYKRGMGPKEGEAGIAFKGKSTKKVDDEGQRSMARRPAFEAAALSFEKKLGVDAARRGNPVAMEMSNKVSAYMDERAGALEEAVTATKDGIDKNYSLLGYDKPSIAGAVGKKVKDIKAVLQQGNIRERMTVADAFTRNVLSADIAGESAKQAAEWAEEAGLHHKRISAATRKYGKTPRDEPDTRAAAKLLTPMRGEVKEHQGTARISNIDEKDRLSKRKLDKRGRADAAGPGLSAREFALANPKLKEWKAGGGKGKKPATKQFLQWAEGARTWFVNEENKWVQVQRELSLPLKAGPSGTTQRLMGTAQLLNVGPPSRARLACIGYLLPIRAHSLVEVMTGAEPFGLPFRKGPRMYTRIPPYTTKQLRGFGIEGKFPHQKRKWKKL